MDTIITALSSIILGKETQLRLSLSCLLSGGHLLIEDLPGMGKTTLAQALAKSLGLRFKRLQFTSDMLPSDITGVSIFSREKESFVFHPGPVFSQVLLADEINRTHPKTQSALLEAMEERQVTVDGKRYLLPKPFFVIASQNPLSQDGTYKLPESQLDRFAMRISLGYPDEASERALLSGENPREKVARLEGFGNEEELRAHQLAVTRVKSSDALNDYILRLIHTTREFSGVKYGLSPRAGLALQRAAKAWAYLDGRLRVVPDDVQAVFTAVAGHRLLPGAALDQADALCARIIESVDLI